MQQNIFYKFGSKEVERFHMQRNIFYKFGSKEAERLRILTKSFLKLCLRQKNLTCTMTSHLGESEDFMTFLIVMLATFLNILA